MSPTETSPADPPPGPGGKDHPSGPRVVALGGGHGLAASLRAIRQYAGQLTAVVSAADDGGSSGRLREEYAVPAPGDIRRCLLALADRGSALTEALAYRFDRGELEGHVAGNLLMTALAQTAGDFQVAIDTVAELLGVQGQVVPSTLAPVHLLAETEQGRVEGQVAIKTAGGVRQLEIEPPDPPCPDRALEAIATADQIVVGPGSLYTSVLACLAVPTLTKAIAASPADRVYVCNLHPELAETAGFDVADHLRALEHHGVVVDRVLFDPATMHSGNFHLERVEATLAGANRLVHDPRLLASVLADLATPG